MVAALRVYNGPLDFEPSGIFHMFTRTCCYIEGASIAQTSNKRGPMAFMIDTANYLTQVQWRNLHAWKGEFPSAAGRYFGGGLSWGDSEFTRAKADTFGALTRVAPLRASEKDHQLTPYEDGFRLGQRDAEDTIARINNAINQGQLKMPAGENVIIYLDVEPDVQITPAFWAGFADLINHYRAGPTTPFTAGIYTKFVANAEGKYVPQYAVRACLDRSDLNWPNAASLCVGFWTSEPEPCDACISPTYTPDWSRLGSYSQPYDNATFPIANYLWQYAEHNSCVGFGPGQCGQPGFANGENVDFDTSGTTGAENLMLVIG